MVKYMCHLTGSSAQLLLNGEVIENRYYGSNRYHVPRDEWKEGAKGVDMLGAQWEGEHFHLLPKTSHKKK
jgi:hypothetical protein